VSLVLCDDPKVGKWPDKFYSWMVSSVAPSGKPPTYNVGQMIVYDKAKKFACRFNEQDLITQDKSRPVDYCSDKFHYRIEDASGFIPANKINCSSNESFTPPVFEWPDEFLSNAQFISVDVVNRKRCNHFNVQSMTVNGQDTQVDVWTGVGDGLMCQMSFVDLNSQDITNFAFDGFQTGYPNSAMQCTSALIKCAEDNWICKIKNGTKDSVIGGALGWVCSSSGGKVDCAPINRGGKHYYPNNVMAHGNWALNQYYQMNKIAGGITACYFNGIGEVVAPQSKVAHTHFKRSDNKLAGESLFDRLTRGLVC